MLLYVDMSSIREVLAGKKYDEPPEIQAIKDYVLRQFQSSVSVIAQDKQIIIGAANAALAATLRMHIHDMQQTVKTDKRLVIRIGS